MRSCEMSVITKAGREGGREVGRKGGKAGASKQTS